MRPLTIHELPYFANSANLFESVADERWAVFLDSSYPDSQQGRYDFIASQPYCTLITRGAETEICAAGKVAISQEDPFQLIKDRLLPEVQKNQKFPFTGGVIGYFAYDLARRLEQLPKIAQDDEQTPEMMVGIYDWVVVVDHVARKSYLVTHNRCPETQQLWPKLIQRFSHLNAASSTSSYQVLGDIESNMTRDKYTQAFEQVKNYLLEGDCYQVNLAQRFTAPASGNPWLAYRLLRQSNPAPFCAFLNFPGVQVLSSSPERFLEVADGIVETKPIKGTRPRKADPKQDRLQIELLAASSKDRAENLMIVDLLRNDLSKNCKKGSVHVPSLFVVESFTTVHHLVSTIRGELDAGEHALDLLKSCFPGGSITGAPKIRAMEIIEELEPHRRGLYCGAIGYVGFNGNMDTNITIRTLVHSSGTVRFYAGGGIVYDSSLEEEYQESFDKAAALLNVLQQMKV